MKCTPVTFPSAGASAHHRSVTALSIRVGRRDRPHRGGARGGASAQPSRRLPSGNRNRLLTLGLVFCLLCSIPLQR